MAEMRQLHVYDCALTRRARGKQHDQRARAVVVGAVTSALALDGGRSRSWTSVSVSRWRLSPVKLAPIQI
jgi:hypothetical protein